jgi:hypothetical protein
MSEAYLESQRGGGIMQAVAANQALGAVASEAAGVPPSFHPSARPD